MTKPGLPKLTKQNMEDAPEESKYIESIKLTVNSSAQAIEDLRANRGIKFLENADVEAVEMEIQTPDPWLEATVNGPWVGTLKYMKRDDGVVEIRISLTGGATNDVICTLPEGYRPYDDIIVPVSDLSFGEFASVGIQQSGVVYCANESHSELGGVISYTSQDTTPVPLSCWPKMIKTKLSAVKGVLVMDVFDAETTNPLPPASVGNPSWEISTNAGQSNVKITNIAGLPYNRKSRVRLLIIGG